MGLPVRQQWSLRRIDYSLRRSDSRLAATMRTFNRFAVEGKIPRHERLRYGGLACWRLLVGALMTIILVVGHGGVASWRGLTRLIGRLRAWIGRTRSAAAEVTGKVSAS